MPESIDLNRYDQLRNRGFRVERGWSHGLAAQLVESSQEPEIRRFTPGDMEKRFPTVAAANEWYDATQPTVYALARTAELAGIIWFSHRPRPELEADHTFAIRMYESARGKGLAEPFIQAAESDFRSLAQPQAIWLETDMDNSRARNLYHKLGYKVVKACSARITMRR
jgi:ribosomal protein S18 acetylase RimI-like enzyme